MTPDPLSIWVVEDDASLRWVMEQAFGEAGFVVRSFADADTCLAAIEESSPDVLLTDVRLPGQDGLALLEALREQRPALPVIVMTAHSDLEHAVAAYQRGAFEYLPKPFDLDHAVQLVHRAAQGSAATEDTTTTTPGRELIGRSRAMQGVFRSIGRLASSAMPVLIEGESGTGKELIARALHRHSPRAAHPFVALNTAAATRFS